MISNDELKVVRELIKAENRGKQQQRRENDKMFIPEEYYTLRMTKKQIFLMQMKRELNKMRNEMKEESDKRCAL